MSAPKQISRAEMELILNERCPGMSPATRQACLTGSVLELDGNTYQAPDTYDYSKPTHRIPAAIEKVGNEWILN